MIRRRQPMDVSRVVSRKISPEERQQKDLTKRLIIRRKIQTAIVNGIARSNGELERFVWMTIPGWQEVESYENEGP